MVIREWNFYIFIMKMIIILIILRYVFYNFHFYPGCSLSIDGKSLDNQKYVSDSNAERLERVSIRANALLNLPVLLVVRRQ